MTDKEKFEFVKDYVNKELASLYEMMSFADQKEKIYAQIHLKAPIKQLEDLQYIILGLENENKTK